MAKTRIGMRNFGKLFSRITFQRLPYYLVLQLWQPIYATSLLRTWNSPYCLRISLRPSGIFHEAVGLLLSREEFDDVVRRSQKVMLDSGLQDFVFDSTAGHVGAITGMLDVLSFR